MNWGPQDEGEAVRAIQTALELESVRSVLRSAGRCAAQGAIAWAVSHPAVTGAIVGVRNEREAAELAGAARLRLAPNERATIAAAASAAGPSA